MGPEDGMGTRTANQGLTLGDGACPFAFELAVSEVAVEHATRRICQHDGHGAARPGSDVLEEPPCRARARMHGKGPA